MRRKTGDAPVDLQSRGISSGPRIGAHVTLLEKVLSARPAGRADYCTRMR